MLFFLVLSKNGDFLGSVEIHGLDGECPELGIWITTSEQNTGCAYEALDYTSAQFGKYNFFYEADVRNEASVRLPYKLKSEYEITDLEPESMITDSGKELNLQGHIINVKSGGA